MAREAVELLYGREPTRSHGLDGVGRSTARVWQRLQRSGLGD
jgi:hypothetical protein